MKKVAKTISYEGTQLKPIVTEKAVMMIERDNVLTFKVPMIMDKAEIKKDRLPFRLPPFFYNHY